jgi:diadenosine tetraphosphate (Ap4A) HIT family hydrolase
MPSHNIILLVTPIKIRYEADSRVDCWFCLASPTCEAHLVASIANDIYVSLPKGSLCEGHVLTIPIPHGGSHVQLSETGLSELLSYKQALAKCYHASYGGAGMVVFERYADTKGTYHMHQQIVPVSANMMGATKKAFERSGARQNLNLKEIERFFLLLCFFFFFFFSRTYTYTLTSKIKYLSI